MSVTISEVDSIVKYHISVGSSRVTIFPMKISLHRDLFVEILIDNDLYGVYESIEEEMYRLDMRNATFGLKLPTNIWNRMLMGGVGKVPRYDLC